VATTPKGLPYPLPADSPPDVPAWMQSLATKLDSDFLTRTDANAAYAPKSETTRVTIGAGAMETTRGTPSLGNPNSAYVYWLLDAAATESVGSGVGIPPGWQTVDVDVWWVNAGTGSGDIVLRLVRQNAVEGVSIGVFAAAAVTVTAGSQNVLIRTRLETGLSASDASRLMTMAVERRGGDAADTLPNDIGVIALVLTKAS
jgi:hypothetical protein